MKYNKKASNNNLETKMNPKEHAQLLNDVLNLNKRPQLKKSSRTEPTLQISEFNLVKSVRGKQGAIRISDLTKVLKKRAKHVDISKKVESARRKAKPLPKPLEKPKAQRIRRTAAFENVRTQLNRWDAVVTSNRASNHLTFPLATGLKLESSKNFTGFRMKTDLQKKLEELEPKVEVFNLEKELEYPLTMQEMLERRKEMAKMRAVQSYKEAKARRQNKIKSKKYRRIQRQEKIKKQMKEFEQLQKSNPEEALKKLEEIERVRAEERASLRHRSTGKWAKSKQVRAKYDKDSRQVLAQQLQISRELTQKTKSSKDSESEEESTNNVTTSKTNDNNPWTNPIKTSEEVKTFLSGYRKFWESENEKIGNSNQNGVVINNKEATQTSIIDETTERNSSSISEKDQGSDKLIENKNNIANRNKATETPAKIVENKSRNNQKNIESRNQKQKPKKIKGVKLTQNIKRVERKKNKIDQIDKKKYNRKFIATSDWQVGILSDDNDDDVDELDTIFDDFEDKIQKELNSKKIKVKKELKKQTSAKKHVKKQQLVKDKLKKPKRAVDLSFVQTAVKPIIDEELFETPNATNNIRNNESSMILDAVLKDMPPIESKITSETRNVATSNNIDPNNIIIKAKPINLNTDIPDLLTLEENEENVDQRGTISEAFEDDDVLEEFKKDKQNEIEGEKPQDINLALPGWGSWGGTGIKPSKRKNKRFIVKFPKEFKRRDDNKGHLIINEKVNKTIKSHLVSEVPFPFKTVKDFEATVRAPIGNTFVPETAFRKLTRPAIKTKLGTIIEPMTDEILLKKKK